MGSVLELLKLTDRYERKARLLPALLSCVVIVPAIGSISSGLVGWLAGLSLGAGFGTVCAVALSYAASAAGRQIERQLWPGWPCDAPTNRWLCPDDMTCSAQQKQNWNEAIKRLVGVDIAHASAKGDKDELYRTINDAVRDLRHQFRNTEHNGLLAAHNEDYGFARNLAGLRVFWLPGAAISFATAWIMYVFAGAVISWALLASAILIVCIVLTRALPSYVRQRADRYAESFFGSLLQLDRSTKERAPRPS